MDIDHLVKLASIFAFAAGLEDPDEGLSAEAGSRTEYMRSYMKERYHAKRKAAIDALGGKCANCGDQKGPFHLDHINKKKKTMRAADIHSIADKKVKKEMKNLQVLCEKCHHIKTRESWDYSTPRSTHGSYWHYRKYNCRCPDCVKAYAKKLKEWREKSKDKT